MNILITEIYNSLKENNSCDIWIDSYTRLILFPIVSQPSIETQHYVVLLFFFFFISSHKTMKYLIFAIL